MAQRPVPLRRVKIRMCHSHRHIYQAHKRGMGLFGVWSMNLAGTLRATVHSPKMTLYENEIWSSKIPPSFSRLVGVRVGDELGIT
jgi:hypothetical protein